MLAKIDFTLLFIKLENSEKPIDIRRHLNKSMKKIILVAKTNNKIYKPKTYKQVISKLIYTKQQKMTIEEEI